MDYVDKEHDLATAKGYAAEIEAVADGILYRHPGSGDFFVCEELDGETMDRFVRGYWYTYDRGYVTDKLYSDLDEDDRYEMREEAEDMMCCGPLSWGDYFGDTDYEWRVNRPRIDQTGPYCISSVWIRLASGVSLDTEDSAVHAGDRFWAISRGASDAIEDWASDLYFC